VVAKDTRADVSSSLGLNVVLSPVEMLSAVGWVVTAMVDLVLRSMAIPSISSKTERELGRGNAR
jgi:hypothetical protein